MTTPELLVLLMASASSLTIAKNPAPEARVNAPKLSECALAMRSDPLMRSATRTAGVTPTKSSTSQLLRFRLTILLVRTPLRLST